MQLKRLLTDDDAVSPVIGVILMVAITVILAAVIATFVLSLGEQVSTTAPSASFTFDLDTGADNSTLDDYGINETNDGGGEYTNIDGESNLALLTITHAGGPTIEAQHLSNSGGTYGAGEWSANETDGYSAGEDISAGNSFEMWIDTSDRINVVWEEDGDSATLQTYDAPDR